MRLSSPQTLAAVAASLFVVLVAACAAEGTASPQGPASVQGIASPSPSISASESAPASSRAPASAAPSDRSDTQITVVAERTQYAPGEPISLRIHNGLTYSITTVDQQAFCGVLRLDQEVSPDVWEEVVNCISGPPPRDVVIEPGQDLSVTWETGLGKGVYRARLVYTVGGAFVAGEASEVTTGRLTVG